MASDRRIEANRAVREYLERTRVRLADGREKPAKPGLTVPDSATLEVLGNPEPFVSRGGRKLAGALDRFLVDPSGRIALDVGASTGGFTDCLLSRGAARVYAVDVGRGQLDPKIRSHPRDVPLERTDVRRLRDSEMPEKASLAVVDVSFIPLARVLPSLPPFLTRDADVLTLVKPQFEVGPKRVAKGGIVRDPTARADAIRDASSSARRIGYSVLGGADADPTGRDGNVEHFLHLRWTGGGVEYPRATP